MFRDVNVLKLKNDDFLAKAISRNIKVDVSVNNLRRFIVTMFKTPTDISLENEIH